MGGSVKRKRSGRRSRLRLTCAAVFAALSNGYIRGFAGGHIYRGGLKQVCVPGLNCYSCPGALGACPIGSLQSALGTGQFRAVLYVCGLLTLFGALLGRAVCGFLCPFGLIQELLYRVPFPKKLRRLPGERWLRGLRWVFLGVFVILLPLFAVDAAGVGDPWFCKYVCPAGTLEGGIPLVLANSALRSAVGFLYTWKLAILAVTVMAALILWRPFCRYLCPLGALYGLFNRVSFVRYRIDPDKCTACGYCQSACGLDIPVWKRPNSMDCVRCGECIDACPAGAIGTLNALKAALNGKNAAPEENSEKQE